MLGQESRGEQLDVVFGEKVAKSLGGVNQGVIPEQEPFPCH